MHRICFFWTLYVHKGVSSVKRGMRDCKLWSLHCFGGWNTNAVLLNACDACEWKNGDDDGRHAGGSGRVGAFLANEGAEQCGYCSPGFIMNVIAMSKELENPGLDEIKEYLSGNLCRCTGYMGQLRAIQKFLRMKKEEK